MLDGVVVDVVVVVVFVVAGRGRLDVAAFGPVVLLLLAAKANSGMDNQRTSRGNSNKSGFNGRCSPVAIIHRDLVIMSHFLRSYSFGIVRPS